MRPSLARARLALTLGLTALTSPALAQAQDVALRCGRLVDGISSEARSSRKSRVASLQVASCA